MKKQVNLLLLFFLGLSGQSFSMEKPLTKELTLGNGLHVIVREDHRAPVACAQIWYKVGASDEVRGITGISHALEHMMFQGTTQLPKDGFAKLISQHGGKNNAFTGDDFTGYYVELDVANLEIGFQAEADRMVNLTLDKEAFTNEIQVIIEERRMRTDDNPQGVVYERFMAMANPIGPYHDPIIGWKEDLDRLTVEDLKKWYQQWYAPNNATLVIVGDVNADEIFKLVQKHFEKIPSRAIPANPRRGELPSLGEKRMKINIPAQLPYLLMGFDVPVLKSVEDEEEIYALVLLSALLDGGESARFNRNLVRGQMVAAKAGTYYDPFKKYSCQFLINGMPSNNTDIKTLEAKILEEIQTLADVLVSDEELQKAKNQILAQQVFERDSMSQQATQIGRLETVGISWDLIDSFADKINAITAQKVQLAAKKYFNVNNLTVAELVPLPPKAEEKV